MEPVNFIVKIKHDVDETSIQSELERLANDFSIQSRIKRFGMLVVSTSQATYENVFNAKLDYQTKTYHNINRGPFQVSDWVELQPAQVPDTLKAKIKYIGLSQKRNLTD